LATFFGAMPLLPAGDVKDTTLGYSGQ
jgi:hypothetical protein